MTQQINPTASNMTFTPPKVGVVTPLPGKINGNISKDTLDIVNAQVPKELKEAGIKKKKSPINIINYMWLGVGAICAAISASEFAKLIKKH